MKKKVLLTVGVFGVAITAMSFNFGNHQASATVPGTNALISINSSGSAAGNVSNSNGMVSGNGKYVTFSNYSSDLVSGDTNNDADIFVRNLATSTTSRVSVSSSGVQADGNSYDTDISRTGRYVVFTSKSSNLIDSSTISTAYRQLYLRDTSTSTTALLTKNSSGVASNGDAFAFGVSSDGRFVLLASQATDLGPTVSNGGYNYYMLDRSSGTFSLLNTKYDGTIPKNLAPLSASMSCDGSLVVFGNSAQLTTQSTTHYDAYLSDIRNGNKLTNLTGATNGTAFVPTISCNGDYIAFSSDGTNLDPAITSNPSTNCWIYTYDRINASIALAEKSSTGTVGTGQACWMGYYDGTDSISDDGTVAFSSYSTNLTSDGTSGHQIYMHSLQTGNTELLSRSSSDTQGNGNSDDVSISSNAGIVGYVSKSTNLVSTSDTNTNNDMFTSLTGY